MLGCGVSKYTRLKISLNAVPSGDAGEDESITVSAPNGSENWETGSTQTITWTSTGITGNVKIELYKDGSLNSTLSADEPDDDSYSWSISSGLADGSDYRIRITSLDDGTVYDDSNADFSLAAPSTITVTDPDGAEDWETGSTHNITWTSVNVTGNVKVLLYKGGSLNSTLTSDTANDGTYSWSISSGLADGSDYKIRITSLSDGTVYDESDANFSLAAPASITVTDPDGSEEWETGSTHNVTWTSVNVTGNVKVELYKGGSLNSSLTSDTANDGTYSWAISSGLADGTDYKIRITSLADGTVYDESDANFELAAPSTITVTAPNGSESWELDSTESITWSSVNLTGNVKIELYKDGSLNSTLTSDTANDGSYSWAISDSLTAAADYRIRITSLADGTVYDESDANFTLADAPSITVTAPNGGEDWDPDTTETITWSSVNITGNVKIELYKDGSLDSTLTSDTANDGTYTWAISASLADGTDYRIRITSLSDGTIYDQSNADFTLEAPPASDDPVITSGLAVWLDANNTDSFDPDGDTTHWVNAIDDEVGELINGPVYNDDDGVPSISFDGSNDYATLSRDNSGMTDGFTVLVWFNPSVLYGTGYVDQGYLLSFLGTGYGQFGTTPADSPTESSWCSGGGSGLITYGFGNGGREWCDTELAVDNWQQVAWRNNDDGSIDAWVNGEKNSVAKTGYNTTAPGTNFNIASENGAYPLETKLSQILVYDRPLTDSEVGQLYDADKGRHGLS